MWVGLSFTCRSGLHIVLPLRAREHYSAHLHEDPPTRGGINVVLRDMTAPDGCLPTCLAPPHGHCLNGTAGGPSCVCESGWSAVGDGRFERGLPVECDLRPDVMAATWALALAIDCILLPLVTISFALHASWRKSRGDVYTSGVFSLYAIVSLVLSIYKIQDPELHSVCIDVKASVLIGLFPILYWAAALEYVDQFINLNVAQLRIRDREQLSRIEKTLRRFKISTVVLAVLAVIVAPVGVVGCSLADSEQERLHVYYAPITVVLNGVIALVASSTLFTLVAPIVRDIELAIDLQSPRNASNHVCDATCEQVHVDNARLRGALWNLKLVARLVPPLGIGAAACMIAFPLVPFLARKMGYLVGILNAMSTFAAIAIIAHRFPWTRLPRSVRRALRRGTFAPKQPGGRREKDSGTATTNSHEDTATLSANTAMYLGTDLAGGGEVASVVPAS